jgi:hypothetical protein
MVRKGNEDSKLQKRRLRGDECDSKRRRKVFGSGRIHVGESDGKLALTLSLCPRGEGISGTTLRVFSASLSPWSSAIGVCIVKNGSLHNPAN